MSMQIHPTMVTESPGTASCVLSVVFNKTRPEKSERVLFFHHSRNYFLGGFLPPDFLLHDDLLIVDG